MKKFRIVPIALAVLAFSMVMSPAALANIISFHPSSVSLYADGNDSVTVMIDELPEGLSLHSFTARVSDPVVAEISQVSFPGWATVNNASAVPSGSVDIRGEDPGDQVVPGATGVALATIHIRAKNTGTSTITIEGIQIEDDAGGLSEPIVSTASIVVTGEGGDTAEGGEFDLTAAQPNGSEEQDTSPPGSTSREATVVPSDSSAGSLPIPMLWIVGIVIMVGAAASVLYLAVKQKI